MIFSLILEIRNYSIKNIEIIRIKIEEMINQIQIKEKVNILKELKVLLCTYEFPPYSFGGGAGIYAEGIAKELSKKGVTIHIIFSIDHKYENEIPRKIRNNIYLYPLKIKKIPGLSYFLFNLKAKKFISDLNIEYNLVHFNYSTLFKVKKVPNFITVHHPYGSLKILLKEFPHLVFSPNFLLEYNPIIEYLDKKSFKRADYIVSVSNFSKNWLVKNYDISSRKIKTIYQGIEIPKYRPDKVQYYIKKYNLKHKRVILFIGRLEIRKGILDLIEALSGLSPQIDYKCIIIGRGPLKNKIIKRIKSYNIADKFIFIEYLEKKDLDCFYHICDIYVQPTYLEGFGLTIVEAMGASKPVITTNTGAITEIIKNKINGILIEPNQVENLREKIIYCLENSEFRDYLGKNASKTVNNRFIWDKNINNLIEYYRKVID
ncbi:MAG: glycosyltransferase [Candidatus Lokiarchaeota archaeon]|nr:glycosyltransferase [Candidatus Lokiarchaeota archaeon]